MPNEPLTVEFWAAVKRDDTGEYPALSTATEWGPRLAKQIAVDLNYFPIVRIAKFRAVEITEGAENE